LPLSMPALLSPAPASSAVSGASSRDPVSMWTSEADGSC
jgi:hypothetical protein